MTITDAHEIQALIKYHASTIVEVIDDGGIKPGKLPTLMLTIARMNELAVELSECKTVP